MYYNPALLAVDNRGKFGYSLGAAMGQKGIGDIIGVFLNQSENFNIDQIWNSYQAHNQHFLSANSQNGVVIQITGGSHEVSKLDENGHPTEEKIEKRNSSGAFTIAAFLSAYTMGNVDLIKANHSITESGSLSASANLAGMALAEIPIGWGWRWELGVGDISFGAAVKYMGALGGMINGGANITETKADYSFLIPKNFHLSQNFGVDLGLLYSIYGFNLGFVAKNINAPTFDLAGRTLLVKPQFRMGVSYEFADYFVLTFDTDLTPNDILFSDSGKTQMIGGGFFNGF